MKLKNLVIDAEEEMLSKAEQYGLTDIEYQAFKCEYNQYLLDTYQLPSDAELANMFRVHTKSSK